MAGPYGEWGSRKYLLASSTKPSTRTGLDYVDIFYSHRFDPETPLEETMGALASAVQQGKALYVGISSYSADRTREAARILRAMGVRALIHQPSYSMLNRWSRTTGCWTRRRPGDGLHLVQSAVTGAADVTLPGRHLPAGARPRRASRSTRTG